jgi:hypothetical protein
MQAMKKSKSAPPNPESKADKTNTKQLTRDLVQNVNYHIVTFLDSLTRAFFLRTCKYVRDLGYKPGCSSPHVDVNMGWLLKPPHLNKQDKKTGFVVPKNLVPGSAAHNVQELTLRSANRILCARHSFFRRNVFACQLYSLSGAFSLPACFPNVKRLTVEAKGGSYWNIRELVDATRSFLGLYTDKARVFMPKLQQLQLVGDFDWMARSMTAFLQPSLTSFSVCAEGRLFLYDDDSDVYELAKLSPGLEELTLKAFTRDSTTTVNFNNVQTSSIFASFPKLRLLHLSRIGNMRTPPYRQFDHNLSFDSAACASYLQTFRFYDGAISNIYGLRSLTNLRELSLSFGCSLGETKERLALTLGRDIPYLLNLEILHLSNLTATDFMPELFTAVKQRQSRILPKLTSLAIFDCKATTKALTDIPIDEVFPRVREFRVSCKEFANLEFSVKRRVKAFCDALFFSL